MIKTVSTPPLKSTLVNLIGRCNSIKPLREIHALLVTSSIIQENSVTAKIINSLITSCNLVYAHQILYHIGRHPDSFLCNSLISGYASSKKPEAAILVYKQMGGVGFAPDRYTFPLVLKSCTKVSRIGEGKQIHGVVFKMGLITDLYIQNALVHLYSVCGECNCAGNLFDEMRVKDVVSWTSLISGYVRGGLFHEAIRLFMEMDVVPNTAMLVSILVACGRVGHLGMGKGIHCMIYKREFEINLVVGNALLDMYVKWKSLEEANQVFHELAYRDRITWTSMISGLVQCNLPKEALEVFRSMQVSRVEPDRVTLATVLSACASLGDLHYGKWVHEYMDSKKIEWDAHIGTAMVDMYSKCGCMEMAVHTFHSLRLRNVFTWNALLCGLAMHGRGREALAYFTQMGQEGLKPNEVTFLATLTACCHSGLVDEGCWHFDQMIRVHNLVPKIEHYGCMVDLFGRAGLLEEAQDLIKSMPMEADVLMWGSMLSAFKGTEDFKLPQHVMDSLLEHEAHDSGLYVLLSNIYATTGRWKDVTRVRRLMKEKGIKKAPGSSSVEVNGKIHEFLVGENNNHPQQEEIYLMLTVVIRTMNLQEHPLDLEVLI